jgi:N-acyl-D-aspartate/D-glutamate deacylase
MHDLVIRGGTIVDGTGAPRFTGDLAIDVGAQVPHGALRVWVMGACGAEEHSVATPADIDAMAAHVRASLAAGALGFSTSRTLILRGADGRLVPGTHAARDEVFGIGRVLGEFGHGVFQMTSNHIDMPAETVWMRELARETGRPVLFNLQQIDERPELWRELVAALDDARAQGVPLVGSIPGRPAGVLYGWRSSIHLPLEDIVRRQTSHTASVYGLHDRGVLAPGKKADVNVIDYARLGFDAPRMAYDLPAGGRRLLQGAHGYVATVVAGRPILEAGRPTGELPGRLVRGG